MITTPSHIGKLYVQDITDTGNYYCKCACGNEVILTEQEIKSQTCSKACSHLRGETCAAEILDSLGLRYEVQKKIDDMHFDFYLPDVKVAIECDGAQHWRAKNNDWNSLYKLQETRDRDLHKNHICEKNNIVLIRVPFWQLNKDNVKIFIQGLKVNNENSN